MPAIIDMIVSLISRNHAYLADINDVYYDVSSFSGYGQLSGKKPGELRAGARVDVNDHKRDPVWLPMSRAIDRMSGPCPSRVC